jgi:hypothetical protein
MATRKNRPVLYEVIRTSRRRSDATRRHVPAPWQSPPRSVHSEARPVEPAGVAPDTPTYPPLMRLDGERVHFALRWPTAAVLGAALLVVMLVAFQAGRGFGGAGVESGADDAEFEAVLPMTHPSNQAEPAAQASPGGVVTPPRESPSPEAAGPQAGADPASEGDVEELRAEKGKSYLVVQHFPRNRLSVAREARDYLRAGGVPCVLTRRGPDYVLIASEGFTANVSDARQRRSVEQRMNALMAKVRQLGKEFAPRGYSFDRCRFEEAR